MTRRTDGERRRRRNRDNGAVAVEFALVFPILGMLLMGIVTFGLGYSDHIALANAVREGARFGASTANVDTWDGSVVTRTQDVYANADNSLEASAVCALLLKDGATAPLQSSASGCETGSTPAGTMPDDPTDLPAGSCFVKVWASQEVTLNWLLWSTPVTLHSASVSAYERGLECS